MTDVVFEFYKGRTYSRDFTITGFEDSIDEVYFTCCENHNNKDYCIRKTYTKGEITIVDSGEDESGNTYTTYNLLLEANDTDHMKTDFEYGFDIAIKSGKQKVQIMTGTLTLNPVYTKIRNEG